MKINLKFSTKQKPVQTGLVVRTQVKVGECSFGQLQVAERDAMWGRSEEEKKNIYCNIAESCGGEPVDLAPMTFGRCKND